MKKDRNSFFSEYGYNQVNTGFPNMNMGMPYPNQAVASNSSFYAGPLVNNNEQSMQGNNNMYSDIDSRLSKIERRLNRLESRVNNLEGDGSINYDNNNSSNNSNMYMV